MRRTSADTGLRGEPLILLAVLLGGWAILRIIIWQPALSESRAAALGRQTSAPVSARRPAVAVAEPDEQAQQVDGQSDASAAGLPLPSDWHASPVPAELPVRSLVGEQDSAARTLPARAGVRPIMVLAARSPQIRIPPALLGSYRLAESNDPALSAPSVPGAVPQPAGVYQREGPDVRRWSGDAWLLWRPDEDSPLLSGRPGYGRSQAGAIIRYELAPRSDRRPQVHLRASDALEGGSERTAAVGFSARLVSSVSLRVTGELRAADTQDGVDMRPAAYAVTELPPVNLLGGLRGEAYAQAGYVGGDFATPFIDGQVRVGRSIAQSRGVELGVGAGAWGGAQKDVARLDVGPSASLTFVLGEARGRLAADYRIRVAGEAEPASGPALTLSAGF